MSLLPTIPAGVQPANIYLFRPHIFFGDGVGTGLYLDGQLVTQLGSGDYTVFQVTPGTHMIASKIGDAGFHSQTLDCKSGDNYYFIARRTIAPISSKDGEGLKNTLTFVKLN